MNSTQTGLLHDLAASLIDASAKLRAAGIPDTINPIPFLTRLAGEFEANQSEGIDTGKIAQVETALLYVGAMAHDNIQGCEARRARAAGDATVTYPDFNWTPLVGGGLNDRLQRLIEGFQQLATSVNQPPPLPPSGA